MQKSFFGIALLLTMLVTTQAFARDGGISCAYDATEGSVKQVIGEGLAADEDARKSDAYVGSTNNLGDIAGACAVEYTWSDAQIGAASYYAVARMGRDFVGAKLAKAGIVSATLDKGFASLSESVRTAFANGSPSDADVEAVLGAYAAQGVNADTEPTVIALVQWVTFNTMEMAAKRDFSGQ